MTSYLGNYLGNLMLDLLHGSGGWLACHEADPTPLGLLDTEVAGNGYGRQRVLYTAPSNRSVASSTAQRFIGMPATRVLWLASWTAASGGGLQFRIPLFAEDTPPLLRGIAVALNGQLLVPAGDVALTI